MKDESLSSLLSINVIKSVKFHHYVAEQKIILSDVKYLKSSKSFLTVVSIYKNIKKPLNLFNRSRLNFL